MSTGNGGGRPPGWQGPGFQPGPPNPNAGPYGNAPGRPPGPPPQYPPQWGGGPHPSPSREPKRTGPPLVPMVLLGVVALALVGLIVYLLVSGGSSEEAEPRPSTSVSESGEPSSPPTTPDPTPSSTTPEPSPTPTTPEPSPTPTTTEPSPAPTTTEPPPTPTDPPPPAGGLPPVTPASSLPADQAAHLGTVLNIGAGQLRYQEAEIFGVFVYQCLFSIDMTSLSDTGQEVTMGFAVPGSNARWEGSSTELAAGETRELVLGWESESATDLGITEAECTGPVELDKLEIQPG